MVVSSSEGHELWYKKDDQFKLPKAYIGLRIYSTDCGFGSTLSGTVFVKVWEAVMEDYLREFDYMGDCAGLQFKLTSMVDSLNIKWSGYNDSMVAFVSGLIERISKMKDAPIEDMFNQVKEKLL